MNNKGEVGKERKVIFKSEDEAKDDCDKCKIYKAANKNLISDLQCENEKLRVLIKDLLMKTGGDPEKFDHLLTPGQKNKTLDEGTEKNMAVQQALSTSVVLRHIFWYFDDENLLQFRRVCKIWADEASPRIQSRIRLSYNPKENTLGKNGVGMLPDLTHLMTTTVEADRKFSCTRFWVTSPNLMKIPDAVFFFEKFGYLIKHLHLELVRSETCTMTYPDLIVCLRNLLFKWTPNLKFFSFSLNSWPQQQVPVRLLNDKRESPSSRNLPNLQSLTWSNHIVGRHVFLDLLKCCPNLKKILNFPCFTGIREAILASKAGAIKELRFQFDTKRYFEEPMFVLPSKHCFNVQEINVQYCLDGLWNPNLSSFSHREQWRPNIQLLNRILENNSNCLKKITCRNLGPLAEYGLKIPIVSNLEILDITTEFDSRLLTSPNLSVEDFFRVFPKGLDVASTFPKLSHVSWNIQVRENLSGPTETRDIVYRLPLLDTMGPLTSVRSLTVSIVEEKNLELLRKIAVCLPNVKVLKYTENFGANSFANDAANFKVPFLKILRIIWELFQGLEEIHLFPHLQDKRKTGFLKYSPAQLVDSAITGLDPATARKFARESQNYSTNQEKDLKVPSIRNMKSLRYLKISIQSENEYPIFTNVSGTHGFGLMRNLTVVIEDTREKRLVIQDPDELMSPNVKFYQASRKRQPDC